MTDDADEMDDPDVEPLRVFCFQEACVEEAFFDDDAPWLRRSGKAEAAVVEEKRLLFLLDIFFSLEEEVGKNAEFFFSFSSIKINLN